VGQIRLEEGWDFLGTVKLITRKGANFARTIELRSG
jgi:hypothetical protein